MATNFYGSSRIKEILTNLKNLLTGKADKSTTLEGYGITDAYTKSQTQSVITNAISGKANASTTLEGYGITDAFTKTQTQTEINNSISGKANTSDVYTKNQTDSAIQTAIAGKADSATTLAGYGITNAYTKTETQAEINDAEQEIYSNLDVSKNYLKINRNDTEIGFGDDKVIIHINLNSILEECSGIVLNGNLNNYSGSDGIGNFGSACLPKGTYILSGGTEKIRFRLLTAASPTTLIADTSFTTEEQEFTTSELKNYTLEISIKKNIEYTNETAYPMIRKKGTSAVFKPYTISLEDITKNFDNSGSIKNNLYIGNNLLVSGKIQSLYGESKTNTKASTSSAAISNLNVKFDMSFNDFTTYEKIEVLIIYYFEINGTMAGKYFLTTGILHPYDFIRESGDSISEIIIGTTTANSSSVGNQYLQGTIGIDDYETGKITVGLVSLKDGDTDILKDIPNVGTHHITLKVKIS